MPRCGRTTRKAGSGTGFDDPKGVVEFERTKEILQRQLPAAPAVIADIGGGPGRYALWLAELGYTVEHRDLMRLHVEQLQKSSGPWCTRKLAMLAI